MKQGFEIYRSSAGSGKTFTLVLNYLELALAQPSPGGYKHILAITFTNKAATEMKERVVEYLRLLSQENPDEQEAVVQILGEKLGLETKELRKRALAMLTHILHRYADFSVSTIDAFTSRIIRSFSRDLQLHPDFSIELDTKSLLIEAVDVVISKAGEDAALTKLLQHYALMLVEDDKDWNFRESLLDIATELLKEDVADKLALLENWSPADFEKNSLTLRKEVRETKQQLALLAQPILEKIAGAPPKTFQSDYLPKWLNAIANGNIGPPNATLTKHIEEANYMPKSAKGERKEWLETLIPQISLDLRVLLEAVAALNGLLIVQQMVIRNSYALGCLQEIRKELERISNERNLLMINRFNEIISDVVTNNPAPFIYERLGERYNHILIDEFQDTSTMQWSNFLPLIQNSLASGGYSMVVGDGKQAIYRFRNGNVEQFQILPEVAIESSLSDEYSAVLKQFASLQNLDRNFRSKDEVVQFNNILFRAMSQQLKADHQGLFDGLEQKEQKGNGGFVEVKCFLAKKKEEAIPIHHAYVLEKIEKALADGYQPEDVAILQATKAQASATAIFLMDNGYKVVSSDSLLLSQHAGVQFVVALIRHMQQPEAQNAAFQLVQAAVMIQDGFRPAQIWDMLAESKKQPRLLVEKLYTLLDWELPNYQWSSLPLLELAQRLVAQHPFLPDNDIYLQTLLDHCMNWSGNKKKGSFIAWWEGKKSSLSLELNDVTGAIQIMTIHKSKGLQFPVVILPEFVKKKKGNSQKRLWALLDGQGGDLPVALLNCNKDLEQTSFSSLYEKEEAQTLLDDINMRYVACTRPKDRLYISYHKEKEDSSSVFDEALEKAFPKINMLETPFAMGEELPFSASMPLVKMETTPIKNDPHRLIDTLGLSLQHLREWNDKDGFSNRQIGTMIHEILAETERKDGWRKVLEGKMEGISISESEQAFIESVLNQLFMVERCAEWFAPEREVRNEWEIIRKDGSLARIDKVVFHEKKIEVIDFKIGTYSELHKDQIASYRDILSEIFDLPVIATLVYLRPDFTELKTVD